jgi:hypothetical protein
MPNTLEQDVRWLKAYAVGSTLALIVLVGAAFRGGAFQEKDSSGDAPRQRFETITAERLNIVEADGQKKMVLANTQRMPDVVLEDGTVLRERGGKPGSSGGLLFYNSIGEEAGGLIYSSLAGVDPDTGDSTYRANGQLSFDQFRNDQVVDVGYTDNGSTREAGLTVTDRSTQYTHGRLHALMERMRAASGTRKDSLRRRLRRLKQSGRLGAYRVFVGSDREDDAVVRLSDSQSNVRLRMQVDSTGTPSIVFLSAEGEVVRRISGAAGDAGS